MTKFVIYTLAATLSMAAVSPCLAADSPWNGTWKVNQAKSKLTGDTFTVILKADGIYHYANGSTVEYDITCDGKSYPTLADRIETCTGNTANGFDFTTMADGKIVMKSRHTVSADGNTHTIDYTVMRPDGKTADSTATYKRIGEGTGMAGKWKSVKEESSQPPLQ